MQPTKPATANYIFVHKRTGGLGLQDPTEEVDIQAVEQAVKILSSADQIAAIARAELLQTVTHASQAQPTQALVSNYLSYNDDRRLQNIRYRSSSLWTCARQAIRRLGLQLKFSTTEPPTVVDGESEPVNAKQVCQFLHAHVQNAHARALMALADQGKVARTLESDPYAYGSTWQYTSLNPRFKDRRLIHRARLNCLPLNNVKQRWSNC